MAIIIILTYNTYLRQVEARICAEYQQPLISKFATATAFALTDNSRANALAEFNCRIRVEWITGRSPKPNVHTPFLSRVRRSDCIRESRRVVPPDTTRTRGCLQSLPSCSMEFRAPNRYCPAPRGFSSPTT